MTTSHPAIAELTAAQVRKAVDLSRLHFDTTADLEPQTALVGQERAVQALQMGVDMPQPGYNIFVSEAPGSGARAQITALLRERAAASPTPGDWVYVHNFRQPDQPRALALDAGQGCRLQQDMDRLVAHLRDALPKAFQQEAFEKEQRELAEKYEQQVRRLQQEFGRLAHEQGFAFQVDPTGNAVFIPLREGEPMSQEDVQKLSDEERQALDQRQSQVVRAFRTVMQQQRQLMQQLAEEIRGVERQFCATVIAPLIDAIKQDYPQDSVRQHLEAAQAHMLSHLEQFKGGASPQAGDRLFPPGIEGADAFLEYRVNVVVDNGDTHGAPVLVEDVPTSKNLFGTIERAVDSHGRVVSDFTRIKAGALLRASGGYLVFNLEDAMTEPFVWKTLKRTLQSMQIKIEAYDPFAFFTISAMQPEAAPMQTKVVAMGPPWLYYMLYAYDPDFAQLFKIKADFGEEMDASEAHQASYAHYIAHVCRDEQLRPCDRSGVEAMIEYGMRRVADQDKLTSQFDALGDLLREAHYAAGQSGSEVVRRADVEQALQARRFRANRVEEKLREMITEGTVLIDTDGSRMGQVNGLAVLQLGDHTFGRPSRVTATVSMGRSGIVNIEREAKMSGNTHDKGVLILSGYLRQMYAQDKPLTLSASLCFEQSYSGIDGDSASSTELFVLLCRLANVPVRQDLAVTGSVNQAGDIQAIGGVNEKIEGFYDVCQERGLTGAQGVIMPQANVRNLMLRPDVAEAIHSGRFHIYPISHVDQGLELLTGMPAGDVATPETLHHKVNAHLQRLARDMTTFGDAHVDGSQQREEATTT